MRYYRTISTRAGLQALKDAKLDSFIPAAVSLMAQGIAAVILYFALGAFSQMTTATRILTAFTPFLALPIAFAIRLVLSPAKLAREVEIDNENALAEKQRAIADLEITISLLQNPPKHARYDDGIFQNGDLVGLVTGSSNEGREIILSHIEDTEGFNINKAFLYQDKLLLVNTVGRSIGSSSTLTVGSNGPKARFAKAVLEGVVCFEIGDINTVRPANG